MTDVASGKTPDLADYSWQSPFGGIFFTPVTDTNCKFLKTVRLTRKCPQGHFSSEPGFVLLMDDQEQKGRSFERPCLKSSY